MKERPILFNGPMVRAVRDGTKTQTRRVVKPQPANGWAFECPPGFGRITSQHPKMGRFGAFIRRGVGSDFPQIDLIPSPYGQPGDRFAVRETFYAWGYWTKRYSEKKRREEWHFVDETIGTCKAYKYEADGKLPRRKRELHEVGWWKRPSIFMPRAASRITLEITGVRVERLQDISEDDALAEGCTSTAIVHEDGEDYTGHYASEEYQDLWESINGPGSWAANPWVWVVDFKRVEGGAT